MKKIIIVFCLILALLFSFFVIANKYTKTANNLEILTINYLDVGQGDAILIQTPENTKILIDGGPDNSILNQLGEVMPFYDNKIDIMILTHPHSDHVVGLTEVLKRYEVQEIYYTGALHTSPDYIKWLQTIKNNSIPLSIVDHQFDLTFDNNIILKFLYPNENFTNQRVKELNNTSIVNKLIYNEVSFLFMGDAEIEVEENLLEQNLNLQSNIIKIGHHGSHSSSSIDFLHKVNPNIAIIQVGTDNKFEHPHLITLKRLERMGIEIYRNDIDSLITIETDGKSIFTNQ